MSHLDEVDCPRPVPLPGAHTSELLLDLEQGCEQRRRGQRGVDSHRRVQESGLVEEADGIGFAKRRNGDDVDLRALPEELYRARQRRRPVAEIRSEPYVSAPHNPTLNGSAIRGPTVHVQLRAMRIVPVVAVATLAAAFPVVEAD